MRLVVRVMQRKKVKLKKNECESQGSVFAGREIDLLCEPSYKHLANGIWVGLKHLHLPQVKKLMFLALNSLLYYYAYGGKIIA